MKKIFAIVGETNWGKSNTLDVLFTKKHYKPLLRPITMKGHENLKFVVIEASNEDRFTDAYLKRLTQVLAKHESENVIYVITISLMFNSKNHNVKPVLDHLNKLNLFDVYYMLLSNSWYGKSLKKKDVALLEEFIDATKVYKYEEEISKTTTIFNSRTEKIRSDILSLIKL